MDQGWSQGHEGEEERKGGGVHVEEERYVETVRMGGRVVTMVGAGVSVAVVKLGSNMDVTGGRTGEWGSSSSRSVRSRSKGWVFREPGSQRAPPHGWQQQAPRRQRQSDRWQEGWGGSSSREQESRVMDGEEEGGGVAQERGSTRGGRERRQRRQRSRGDNGWWAGQKGVTNELSFLH